MGDEDDGFALGVEAVEGVEDFQAGLRVEVAGRLVGEDEERVIHQRAGDGDALLLPAGELLGAMVEAVAQTHHLREPLAVFETGGEVAALVEQGDVDVLDDGELLDEVVALEDEAQRAPTEGGERVVIHRRHVHAAEEILPGAGPVEAAEDVEKGGLAGTGRAHDGDVFAGHDGEVHAPQRAHLDVTHPV